MKVFRHNRPANVKEEPLERVDVNGLRHYKDSEGLLYMSATSFLSKHEDKSFLVEWKKRVGEEEARRISRLSTVKGTAIHLACERLLNNEEKPERDLFFDELYDWNILKPALIKSIDNIVGQEIRMKSKKLMLAGTADCIAEFDSVLSMIDFKTSKRYKSKEDIWSYWIQTAIYAIMAWEMWGLRIDQLVIVMIVDKEQVLVYKEPSVKWMKEVIKLIEDDKNNAK